MFIERVRSWIGLACLVAAPIDVLDVLGFSGGFVLTPFLLLSVLYVAVVVAESITKSIHKLPVLAENSFGMTELSAAGFIWFLGCSLVFLSTDPLGVAPGRLVYTSWLIMFALFIVNHEGAGFPLMISRAARLFILLDICGVIAQLTAALLNLDVPKYLEGLTVEGVNAVFRPSGLISDANRAAVVLVLFAGGSYQAAQALPKEKRLGSFYFVAATILVLITISRTGLVALALFLTMVFANSTNKKKVTLRIGLGGILLICGLYVYLAEKGPASFTDPVSDALYRSTQREDSTNLHFEVMAAGFETFAESAKIFLIGTGWGTEYKYVEDFFPGNKYGNFHCMYLSIGAQAGVLALACFLIFFARPWSYGGNSRWLTLIFLWSGLFYEFHGVPFWWILLIAINKGALSGIYEGFSPRAIREMPATA